MHPELKIPPEVQEFCDNLSATASRHVERGATSEPGCGCAEQFSSAERASVLEQYAFTPAHPKPIAYLTANFLHGGWLHLIGKVSVARGRDTRRHLGRLIYPIVYFLAGAAALQFHAWLNPGSLAPLSAPPAP